MLLLTPRSHSPDQPAIAPPTLNTRAVPRKYGSAKADRAMNGTDGASSAENM